MIPPLFRGNWLLAFIVLTLNFGHALSARANETDQFTLPPRETFADTGPYFSHVHYQVLKRVVDRANESIRRAAAIDDPVTRRAEFNRLHSPAYFADRVREIFGAGFFEMMDIEDALRRGKAQRMYPGKTLIHKTIDWIYADTHLPIDPRKVVLLVQSSTVKVYGSYIGVDKFGHFHDLGHIYFKTYLGYRSEGMSDEKAVAEVVKLFSEGPISEGGLIGALATGVYSNADLTANYVGMKFYRNLLEPVKLKGVEQPPLIVPDGDLWRLNDHVGPRTDFFRAFVSDHFNEAINPCIYEIGMRDPIANRLRRDAKAILAFYADDQGNPRPREWFENKARELSTYFGEPYGHSGWDHHWVTISNTCWPAVEEQAKRAVAHDSSVKKHEP